MELDNKQSADDSHHSLDAFKDSLIRDFLMQLNLMMQPRFAIELGESVYVKKPSELPSPRHQATKSDQPLKFIIPKKDEEEEQET